MGEFDRVMNFWESVFGTQKHPHRHIVAQENNNKIIIFEKGHLLFIFNFHHEISYQSYMIGVRWLSDYMILYDTDEG